MLAATQKRDKGEIKLWDPVGKEGVALEGQLGWPLCLKFSPDGRYIAAGFADQTLKVWDAASGKVVATLTGHTGQVRAMAFSPDGKRLASVSSHLRLWDVPAWKAVPTPDTGDMDGNDVAYSPDGQQLAVACRDQSIKVIDAANGSILYYLPGHADEVTGVSFAPDGRWLASASKDLTIRFWDLTRGKTFVTLRGHSSPIKTLAFSPDGRQIASAGTRGEFLSLGPAELKLWDATQTDQEAASGPDSGWFGVPEVVFSPDNRWLGSGRGRLTAEFLETTWAAPCRSPHGPGKAFSA
jgi:WD40 repeat protein